MKELKFCYVLALFCTFSVTRATSAGETVAVLASFSSKYGFPDQGVIEALSDHPAYKANLGVALRGEGSHRTLHYALDAGAVACGAQIIQELPPELFVDPYELQGLARKLGQAITFEVRGEVDLETPAPGCTPTLLVGRFHVLQSDNNVSTDVNGNGYLQDGMTIAFPMHTKYPEPELRSRSKNGGPFSWLFGGIVAVVVPRPILLVEDCEGGWRVVRHESSQEVVWDIPNGSLQHLVCVQWGTMLIVLASMLVILGGVVLEGGGKERLKRD